MLQLPSARWQKGEESQRGMGGVIHNSGGLADAAFGVGSVNGRTPMVKHTFISYTTLLTEYLHVIKYINFLRDLSSRILR